MAQVWFGFNLTQLQQEVSHYCGLFSRYCGDNLHWN